MNVMNLLQNSSYALIAFAFMYAAKLIEDLRTRDIDDDKEIEENSNLALAFRRAGINIAIGLSLLGALYGEGSGYFNDLKLLVIDGIIVLPIIMIARKINDVVLLRGINNDEAIVNKNVAVGVAEFGSLTATGLIMAGAFTGEGGGIYSVLIFAGLGQLALVAFALVYQWRTPFDVVEEIKSGNVAAGIGLAGMLCALGTILRASIAGDSAGFSTDLLNFAVSGSVGVVLLLVLRQGIDYLFLPGTTLADEVKRDKNVAALVLTYGTLIAVAVIISSVV